MSGFTQGPWHRLEGYAEPGHPAYKAGRAVMRIVQARAPGQTEFVKVALVDSDHVFADAALIASAPEMLKTAKLLCATLTYLLEHADVGSALDSTELSDATERLHSAIAAIAKAEASTPSDAATLGEGR